MPAENLSFETAKRGQLAEPHVVEMRGFELFSGMPEDSFETLMRTTHVQAFPPRTMLITEAGPPDFLHVVLSGSVELFSNWNGRETSVATVRPVGTFILAASIRNAPYLMSARTLEESRVAMIPSEEVRAMFDSDAAFAHAIVNELAQCFRTVVKHNKDLKLRTSLERLANYLLREMQRNDATEFDLNTEKRRLASFLGMTPENLSRAFKGLEKHGLRVKGSRITIANLQDLTAFAKPSPLIDDFTT
ncbi:helix-turn-helix domain-containing protein [Roseovarius aestuarii]|nr:helix-turn-helix domain-containing protein [Roseovarius aestuarii]